VNEVSWNIHQKRKNELKQFSGVLQGCERMRYTEVWRGQRVGSTNGWVDIKQDAKDGIRTCQKEPELYHIKPVNVFCNYPKTLYIYSRE